MDNVQIRFKGTFTDKDIELISSNTIEFTITEADIDYAKQAFKDLKEIKYIGRTYHSKEKFTDTMTFVLCTGATQKTSPSSIIMGDVLLHINKTTDASGLTSIEIKREFLSFYGI